MSENLMGKDPSKYQVLDHEIVDYHVQYLEGIPRPVRGPVQLPLKEREFMVCTGAAQTFGRFVEKPYPALLQERLEVQVLNLSIGGMGATQYCHWADEFVPYINRGNLAVIQIVTGRNEPNSLVQMSTRESDHLISKVDGTPAPARFIYEEILQSGDNQLFEQILEETRASWVENFTDFLNQINVPKILFWFSKRGPEYEPAFENINKFFGGYPQLVTDEWIAPLLPLVDEYVECITDRGLPHPLVNRFTGQPVVIDGLLKEKSFNNYYPSPEMHQDAAATLYPICARYLK